MSAISSVNPGVWRWDGVDVDHGFPIVGYVVSANGGVLLVDPPATSGTIEDIKVCGDVQGILLTSAWHVRGAGQWKSRLEIPIIAPATAEVELAAVDAVSDRTISEGDEVMGWQVLQFESKNGKYNELAYWHPSTRTVIIGDLFTQNDEGQIVLGPTIFMDVASPELTPFIERLASLQPERILSAHLGPVDDAMGLLTQFVGGE